MLQAKKSLGQHFLTDENIARKIVDAFYEINAPDTILEVGPGQGALTKYLLTDKPCNYFGVELDQRMIPLLISAFPALEERIFNEDILTFDFSKTGSSQLTIIGNFPYNISSQILFKVYDHKETVQHVVGMFQKEVAKRIVAGYGNKEYGILSVLLQAFYDVTYLFDVSAGCFSPPPKITSGVIRLVRKEQQPLLHDEEKFRQLVKSGFGQRRKTLRNSLRHMINHVTFLHDPVFDKRAEQLSVGSWIELSNRVATPA
ncbi:MAG: 16S rRNA (adenine(1518)-N(6)/adenine(1519)-N(6))-dimethyltransferase RsmA [Chitinophagales bacterium]|nr:16S rRNA (adenine(1518)-N(6)/adenine(1519)-N(6))-dimethyltransferase RsmA [Chitinophagales bacterium]